MFKANFSTLVLPQGLFFSLMVSGSILAACYGSTFMLTDYLIFQKLDPTLAGSVVSSGIVSTLSVAFFAGIITDKIGLSNSLAFASLLMVLSMLCFSALTFFSSAVFIGGILLGAAWSIFYILAPLAIIERLESTARIKYLTYLSGAQMLGLGLSAPLEDFFVSLGVMYNQIYVIYAALSGICFLLFRFVGRETGQEFNNVLRRLSLKETQIIMTHVTALPVIMIGLLACIFSGLTTFQSMYARSRDVDPAYFFLVFTIFVVALRFGVAANIASMHIYKLARGLSILILIALALFFVNQASLIVYIIASSVFAIGYGLSYSTLNCIVVNIAEKSGLSISSSSQVFTLSYFSGVFGFPFIAGEMIRISSVDAMYIMMCFISLGGICIGYFLNSSRGNAL